MRKAKDNIIKIHEETRINNEIILEAGDRIKVIESSDQVLVSYPCKNFRKDTEQCRSGCNTLGIRPNGMCPYEVRADSSLGEEPQSNCPCYE